jgi:serine protease SohB
VNGPIARAFAWLSGERRPVVPVLRLHGVIAPTRGLARPGQLSAAALGPSIDRACSAKRGLAVALSINSPGGTAVQAALIAARIRRKAEEKGKKVIAFVEDVGASGGYWLACAADEIVVHPCSIVGSIGVISAGFGFVDAIHKLGVERRLHTAGVEKSMLDPFVPEDAGDVARLREIQAAVHEAFKTEVRSRRGERLKADSAGLFEGRIYTGHQAVEVGLADGLGDLHGILRERFGPKVRLPVLGAARPGLLRRLGVIRGEPPELGVRLVHELAGALDEHAHWARYGL